jgi:hypothetical protein
VFSEADLSLIHYAWRLVLNAHVHLTILDPGLFLKQSATEGTLKIMHEHPGTFEVLEEMKTDKEFLCAYDLMMVSMDGWIRLISGKNTWLVDAPSALIIKF